MKYSNRSPRKKKTRKQNHRIYNILWNLKNVEMTCGKITFDKNSTCRKLSSNINHLKTFTFNTPFLKKILEDVLHLSKQETKSRKSKSYRNQETRNTTQERGKEICRMTAMQVLLAVY